MKHKKIEVSKESKKGGFFRKLKWILMGSAGLCLLIFLGTPIYLSSSGGTNLLLGKINSAMDGHVAIDDLSVGWFKGVELTNLSYADSSTSLTVRRLETKPKLMALLGKKVHLNRTVVEGPQVHIKVPAMQPSMPSEQVVKKTPTGQGGGFDIGRIDLEVIDGSATIELTAQPPQTLRLTNIDSKVQVAEAGKPSAAELSMTVDESSTISAKGSATPSKTGWTLADGDFSVQVSKLELASLKPLFAMAGKEMDMAGELNADATIQVAGGQLGQLKVDAQIDHFAQGTGEKRVTFDKPVRLSAATSGSGETMKIESLNVDSDFCKASCSGTMKQLDYTVDADLAQTLGFAGQFKDMKGLTANGHVKAGGKVSLFDEQVGITSDVAVRQLTVQKDSAKTPVTDAAMDINCVFDKTANQLQIARMDLKATPGQVSVKDLSLPLSGQAIENVSLDAEAKLDLAGVWPFVQVFADVPADLKIAGMLDSAVKVSTQGSQVQLVTKDTRIDKLKIARADSEPFVQDVVNLNGDIVLDTAEQTVDVRSMELTGVQGQSLIEVTKGKLENKKISGEKTHLKGDFEAAYDLKTVSALGAAYLPEGLTLEGRRQDTIHFESIYPTAQPELMTKNLDASASFGFNKAAYQGLVFGPTQVALNVEKGHAKIDIPDANVNGGKVRFYGDVDLSEEPMILRLREPVKVVDNVSIDDLMTARLLQYLNPVFARGTGVTGTASLSCSSLAIPLGGDSSAKNLELVGTVGLTDVRVKSPLLGMFKEVLRDQGLDLFTISPSPFSVKDGWVRYEDMPMRFGRDFALHFGGAIGLDQQLAMTVGVPVKERMIPVALGGTLTHPKPDLAKLALALVTTQIPIKDDDTREAVEKGLELLDELFKNK